MNSSLLGFIVRVPVPFERSLLLLCQIDGTFAVCLRSVEDTQRNAFAVT